MKQYPLSVQVQGRAWASRHDVTEALDDLEAFLSEGEVPDPPPFRVPGRVDLACDVWIRDGDPDVSEFVDQLHRGLRPLEAERDWSTRMSSQQWSTRCVGSRNAATWYAGDRSRLMVRIYRKDLEFKGNTLDAYRSSWREAGWDGSGAVVRVEFEIHRQWLRERGLDEWSLADLEAHLGDLWRACLDTISYRPGEGRVRRREESLLWNRLRAYSPGPDTGLDLRTVETDLNEDALRARVDRAVWACQEAFGKLEADVELIRARDSPPEAPERQAWASRSRWTGHKDRRKRVEQSENIREEEATRYFQTDEGQVGILGRERKRGG